MTEDENMQQTEPKTGTMTDNYIDIKHEYFGPPDDNGFRLRSVDVWYATKPTVPQYGLVDYDDKIIEGAQADVKTAWTVAKAGQDTVYIFDRDDINGLRELLNELELDFDRRDMEELSREFHEDNAEREENDDDKD
jgi:hypothetical protein